MMFRRISRATALIACSLGLAFAGTVAANAASPEPEGSASMPRAEEIALADEVSSLPINEEGIAAYAASVDEATFRNFVDTELVASTEQKVTLTPATTNDGLLRATQCWNAYAERISKNNVRAHIAKNWVNFHYCTSGGKVTSVKLTGKGGEATMIGWHSVKSIDSGAGISGGTAKGWAQHQFVLKAGPWDVQTIEPCVRGIGKLKGAVSSDTRCSVVG